MAEFGILKGKVLSGVENIDDKELIFIGTDGTRYVLFHDQDCCEHVTIEDICGDLKDLIGYPVLIAEEVSNRENPKDINSKIINNQNNSDYENCSYTWTFYKISTVIGSVTIRWYGESNGWYSEKADLKVITGTSYCLR